MNNTASIEVFIRNWSVYQKVIATDYMNHSRFAALTFSAMQKESANGPLSILDLGCGDADLMAMHLKQVEVKQYSGYDFSPTALQLAAINLSFLGDKVQLVEGPMEIKLPDEAQTFDLVHSSFAIHHLADEQKTMLFTIIAERLAPGGLFIYVDTYRQPGMNRETCLDYYIHWMRKTWNLISTEEMARIEEHITAFDYPAPLSFIEQTASTAGLQVEEKADDDPRHFYMSFRKK